MNQLSRKKKLQLFLNFKKTTKASLLFLMGFPLARRRKRFRSMSILGLVFSGFTIPIAIFHLPKNLLYLILHLPLKTSGSSSSGICFPSIFFGDSLMIFKSV